MARDAGPWPEVDPPAGVEPLEWVLLTNVPVANPSVSIQPTRPVALHFSTRVSIDAACFVLWIGTVVTGVFFLPPPGEFGLRPSPD